MSYLMISLAVMLEATNDFCPMHDVCRGWKVQRLIITFFFLYLPAWLFVLKEIPSSNWFVSLSFNTYGEGKVKYPFTFFTDFQISWMSCNLLKILKLFFSIFRCYKCNQTCIYTFLRDVLASHAVKWSRDILIQCWQG